MNTPLQRLFKAILMLLLSQALAGCAGINYMRDDKGQPVEGVVVILIWEAAIITPADTRTDCSGFAVSRSDQSGGYTVHASPQYGRGSISAKRVPTVFYKKGYVPFYDYQNLGYALKVDDGSFDAVFPKQAPYNNGLNCTTREDLKKAGLCPVLQEIGEEQAKRAKTKDEKEQAHSTLQSAIKCEFGPEESYKRQQETRKKYNL